MDTYTHMTGTEIPEAAISAARDGKLLPGYCVERDSDGDWVLIPPEDVTIFSAPGEGVLLGAQSESDAFAEAIDYLAT
jgi:hypothetical protein